MERLRTLSERYPLAFLPGHRSYLDPLVLRSALHRHGFVPNHVLGGSTWASGRSARSPVAAAWFIRRSVRGEPVYTLVLREYIGYLVRRRFNIEWYIEGGRTRTGKLRPPRYGLLNYLVDAFREGGVEDVMLVPTSIVYDEFLFARKREFEQELRAELAFADPDSERLVGRPGAALAALEGARLLLAPRVLASFLEAYLVVAERLAAREPRTPLDEKEFVTRSSRS